MFAVGAFFLLYLYYLVSLIFADFQKIAKNRPPRKKAFCRLAIMQASKTIFFAAIKRPDTLHKRKKKEEKIMSSARIEP